LLKEKLAAAFDADVMVDSSLRRIQRFMSEYLLDTDLIARFVFALLPHKPPYRLALDRTNWKFGTSDINALVLAVVYKGLAIPILYTMMPKFGNSSTAERIELMQRYIDLFGVDTIDCLLADREFVGDQWLAYLNTRRIRYHIRIRENFWIDIPRNGHRVKASWLFNHLQINQYEFYRGIVYVNGQLCYLSASKIKNKMGIPELQIIASFNKPDEANSYYKERWQIGVSREGHIVQSVKVRSRLIDSNLVAWEAPCRETKTVKPSDKVFIMENEQHYRLQRAVNAEVASLHVSPVAETVDNVRRQQELTEKGLIRQFSPAGYQRWHVVKDYVETGEALDTRRRNIVEETYPITLNGKWMCRYQGGGLGCSTVDRRAAKRARRKGPRLMSTPLNQSEAGVR